MASTLEHLTWIQNRQNADSENELHFYRNCVEYIMLYLQAIHE